MHLNKSSWCEVTVDITCAHSAWYQPKQAVNLFTRFALPSVSHLNLVCLFWSPTFQRCTRIINWPNLPKTIIKRKSPIRPTYNMTIHDTITTYTWCLLGLPNECDHSNLSFRSISASHPTKGSSSTPFLWECHSFLEDMYYVSEFFQLNKESPMILRTLGLQSCWEKKSTFPWLIQQRITPIGEQPAEPPPWLGPRHWWFLSSIL